MSQIQVNDMICKNPEIPQHLEEMYNNKKYSDTVFHVNQAQFHASSHLVSVSCKVLASMLDEHFENCGDRELKIGPMKYETTFAVILKFIYGLEMQFSQLGIEVLCEALFISEEYKLPILAQQIKGYLSKIDTFQIDTIVPLLNTAKKFDLQELYEQSKLFVYQNADSCVKHSTFLDLQYDIVMDFIKSDLFCMDEIDILKSILTWHDGNIINSSTIDLVENNDEEMVTEFEDQEEQSNENNLSMEVAGSSDSNRSASNMAAEISTLSEENKNEDVLKTFSEKVLITLLSHVRFELISVLKMNQFSHTDLFKKYKDFFVDFKYASTISEPRKCYIPTPNRIGIRFSKRRIKCYIPPSPINTNICDITRTFTINCHRFDTMCESLEEEIIGDIKLKLCMTAKYYDEFQKLTMYLKCSSDVLQDWELTANFQLKLLSGNDYTGPPFFIPGDGIFTLVTLSSNKSCVHFGDFNVHLSWRNSNLSNFKIHVKSIQFKKSRSITT